MEDDSQRVLGLVPPLRHPPLVLVLRIKRRRRQAFANTARQFGHTVGDPKDGLLGETRGTLIMVSSHIHEPKIDLPEQYQGRYLCYHA